MSRRRGASKREYGDEHDQRIAALIRELLATGPRQHGGPYQVFLLSPAEDAEIVHLVQPIENDTTSATGRPIAWPQNHRYVNFNKLTSGADRTSQLA